MPLVSILILMEVTLEDHKNQYHCCSLEVSILILMEVTLEADIVIFIQNSIKNVSILILMEVTLEDVVL